MTWLGALSSAFQRQAVLALVSDLISLNIRSELRMCMAFYSTCLIWLSLKTTKSNAALARWSHISWLVHDLGQL